MGQGGFLIVDDRTFGVGEGVVDEGDKGGAGKGVEQEVKDFAVGGGSVAQGTGGELGVEFASSPGLSVE